MRLSQFCQIKWERAKDLKRRGKLAEAEQELQEALEEAPDSSLLKASLAELYVRQGRLLEAKGLVEEVFAADPHSSQALVVQGEIAFKKQHFAAALESYRQARERDPRPYLTVRIARTLREMEQYEEALETLDSGLVAHRENTGLLKERALVLNRMQRPEEALRLYERLRQLAPEDRFVRKEVLRLKGLQRPDLRVVSELQTVVKIPSEQNNAQLHGLLAQKLKEVGQVREAAVEYRTASRLEPDNPYFVKQEGFCHYSLRQYNEALECLGQAFRQDPGDYYVKGALEKIYDRLGRLDEFIILLEEVHHLHPHNVKLLGAIKKLRRRLSAKEADDN